MFFLIITFGFLLAVRGARPAPLQKPSEGLRRVWRESADLFLTLSLLLASWTALASFEKTQFFAREYTILGLGLFAYGLARYQKKTDVFFLAATVMTFAVILKQDGLLNALSLAWIVSVGIAIFQGCFLGLRYKLLFSQVPDSMRGWPILCLLAGFISMALWGVGRLVF